MLSQPEIILPRRRSSLSNESLDQIARVLDECFHIPGTHVRFGLDALVGLVPGIGDVIGGFLSFIIVFSAWLRGIPKIALMHMVVNIGLDVVVGTVPFFGDAFVAWWKVNRRNFNLLMRYEHAANRRRETSRDWLFFLALSLIGLLFFAIPIAVIWLIVHWMLLH
jgi:hypothetical protein